MTYDVAAVRAQFPALEAGIAHFEGPGGTQTPQPVIDAIGEALANPLSNRGRLTQGERNAEAIVGEARQAFADLLGAEPAGIVFGRSATQLAYDFSRHLAESWEPGDEIVVTRLDHDANIRPWVQAAEHAGATVRWVDFDPATGELDPSALGAVLSDRTRLVAVTAASNLIGTRPDVESIAQLAHEVGALVFVDGVHLAAHAAVDLDAMGADFLMCSAYKFLGPHFGILAARPERLETLRPDKLLPSGNEVPERFEYGTLPYELLAGGRAAIDFLAGLGPVGADGVRRDRLRASFATLESHEDGLRAQIEEGLRRIGGVTVHSRASRRTPTLLMTFETRDAVAVSRHLATAKIAAPSGSFYAIEASRWLGLGDAGGLRVGLAPYVCTDDVDRLLTGIEEFVAGA
jgi:cysteine desulfurase family protein (TIGR01976 family)